MKTYFAPRSHFLLVYALMTVFGLFLASADTSWAGEDGSVNLKSVRARSSAYGPRHNIPRDSSPRHAYSPFDNANKPPTPALVPGRDYMENRLVIKLAPAISAVSGGAVPMSASGGPRRLTSNGPLNDILVNQGVVSLEPIFSESLVKASRLRLSGTTTNQPDLTRWHRARLNVNTSVASALATLTNTPGIEIAEPDFLRRPVGDVPPNALAGLAVLREAKESVQTRGFQKSAGNGSSLPGAGTDPLYDQSWHLAAAKVPDAWAYLESQGLPPGGSRDIVVAVIDTGVDYNHPDLAANIWTNSREIPGNGSDDDKNGFVDDVHGCSTVSNTGSRSGDPMDDHGHGTHVAGIIAAQGNNGIGGVGVAYNVQIMAIKAAQYSGVLAVSDIAEGINYAVAQGADVINMSFGGYFKSQVEEDALAVAFGQCVLVAAAGNDGYNILQRPMFPAAYSWILGVMASKIKYGALAEFSNFGDAQYLGYEVMAPGVDVWSTLPNGQYAAWDGTSMAAPVISGIAALARTRWSDKNIYSSRFIMGQIVATGILNQGRAISDALAALTVTPKPELSYIQHWVFDTIHQAINDNNDGIVDSGETIDLAIEVRNHWGKADQVSVMIEAWAPGAVQADPYVTWITNTVDYGAVGSFNWDDNGLIYDAQKTITGVRNPFRFKVDINCPNDHVISCLVSITCRNGFDSADTTIYSFQSRFDLVVKRGRALPRIISTDLTITKDDYWIVSDQTLVQAGATLKITEGTQLQFFTAAPNNPYAKNGKPSIQVEGKLMIVGTVIEPVELFPDSGFQGYPVYLFQAPTGNVQINYARIQNPIFSRLNPYNA